MMAAASSHAPGLYNQTYEGWQRIHEWLNTGHTQPPETALEDQAWVAATAVRQKSNFDRMKKAYTDFKPDVIITIFGDQREWFDKSNIPNLVVYRGPDSYAHQATGRYDQFPVLPGEAEELYVPIVIDRDMASFVLDGLVRLGFDAGISDVVDPQLRTKLGFPHGLGNMTSYTHPEIETPVVPIILNVDNGPPVMMSGKRCIELGRAIAQICEKSDKRILITGSGGMSHNPMGVRSGWVDEVQDNEFLKQLHDGNIEGLSSWFSFRSEQFDGAGGELRTWIVAAAAMDYMKPGRKAAWSDYFAARKTTTGCGWVYYDPISTEDVAVHNADQARALAR